MKAKNRATLAARRFPFTEEEMGDAFERLLRTRKVLMGVGRFSRVFREVDCHRGRADFVALAHGTTRFLIGTSVKVKSAGSLLLSFLHERAPRSLDYLCEQSGLTQRTVKSAVSELARRKYVLQTKNGSLLLNPKRPLRQVEVWAFELKLDKPKRAVFQAQQYRSFAQGVLIIVPPEQLGLYDKFDAVMRRWGIGLASFSPLTNEFILERPPRLGPPLSRHHQAYALFQLLGAGGG